METFDVWFHLRDGGYLKERSGLSAEEAVRFAKEATLRPAAKLGILEKIQITDEGDYTVFLWEHDKGIVFPTVDSHLVEE